MDDVDALLKELESLDDDATKRPPRSMPGLAAAPTSPSTSTKALSTSTKEPAVVSNRARSGSAPTDDLDELLKTIESPPRSGSFKYSSEKSAPQSKPQSMSSLRTAVHAPGGPTKSANASPLPNIAGGTRKRCFPVCIGGTSMEKGLTTSLLDQKTCSNLRCTKCDWRVSSFEGVWHQRCDYMFFRNNMPDYEKLRVNLIPKPGHLAYSCQCTWRSVSSAEQLDPYGEVRWVCGGHAVE
eukprot:tig00000241_g20917.t1